MEVDPRRLAVLLAVHRNGGVLAAADTMRVTASAISQQIARLEAEVGQPVLDRQPSGAVLTPAGRVLADAAERIEAEIADAERALHALGEDLTGTVVVGAFQTVIRSLLMPLLLELQDRLPGVELLVRELSAERGQRELRSGAVDMIVVEAEGVVGRTAPRYTQDVPILEEPWLVVMPASAPLPTTLRDLDGQVWLGVEPGTAAARATERVRTTFRMDAQVSHRYDDYDVALAMVAGGLGITLLPALALQGEVPDGVQVASVPGVGTRRLIVRHRATRTEPRAAVQVVIDEVVRAAANLPLGPA